MREKQFITVADPSSRDYVRMSVSKSLYVDDNWFSKFMGEDKDRIHGKAKNYPVEMRAMKIRWFILSQYGNKFLEEVLNNENLELYNIPTQGSSLSSFTANTRFTSSNIIFQSTPSRS